MTEVQEMGDMKRDGDGVAALLLSQEGASDFVPNSLFKILVCQQELEKS